MTTKKGPWTNNISIAHPSDNTHLFQYWGSPLDKEIDRPNLNLLCIQRITAVCLHLQSVKDNINQPYPKKLGALFVNNNEIVNKISCDFWKVTNLKCSFCSHLLGRKYKGKGISISFIYLGGNKKLFLILYLWLHFTAWSEKGGGVFVYVSIAL